MKRLGFLGLLVACAIVIPTAGGAAPYALIAQGSDVLFLDLGAVPSIPTAIFSHGELGSSAFLDDLEVAPDGSFALITDLSSKLHKIGLNDPSHPSFEATLDLPFRPTEVEISPNGQFALVASFTNQMAIVRLNPFALTTVYTFTTPTVTLGCLEIAPDSRTVIACDSMDFTQGRIVYGEIDPSSGLISESTLPTDVSPINAIFAQDHQTVLVATLVGDVGVFRNTAPGVVVPGSPDRVAVTAGGQQGFASIPSSDRIVVNSAGPRPDTLSILRVDAPGSVVLERSSVASLSSDAIASSGFIGTDTMAVAPRADFLLVGQVGVESNIRYFIDLISLSDFSKLPIAVGSVQPSGLAIYGDGPVAGGPIVAVPALSAGGILGMALALALIGAQYARRNRSRAT